MSDVNSLPNAQTPGVNRLWAPWRLAYVAGGQRETGCIFCNRFNGNDDRTSLVLHRGVRCFVIMNLYPYATGHLMIVPNDHIASPETAAPATLGEIAALLPICLRVMRATLACTGFNAGMNLGAVAGAGVADHLHEHVVPRWQGDANFMPVLASTAVMPELLPVTYAKLRAEFERDRHRSIRLVILNRDATRVLVDCGSGNPRLPEAFLTSSTPVWRSAVDAVAQLGANAALVDWAGAESVSNDEQGAFLMQTQIDLAPSGMTWSVIESTGLASFDEVDRSIMQRLRNPALVKSSE